ncbi:MAG: glutaredoxin [Candidatus Azotimanducaceae bacterium]|jgi:glutaredoxin|tara:strand:+ start:944 stop:1192 length:249 start_codon:yes stop_codon:yes gene_type:complete
MITVQLYTTLGCHLCEQALALLKTLSPELNLSVEEIEIADSDDLVDRYGIRIPVVTRAGSGLDLGWPFDTHSLKAFLTEPNP